MISRQKASLLLVLFCCLLLAGCTQNATPHWWQRAEITYGILKEPLLRVMAISIPWCWVFAFAIYLNSYEQDIFGFIASLFSPPILWVGIAIVAFVLDIIIIPLLTYGFTGTAYFFNFDFLFFCTLAMIIAIPAVLLLVFFVGLLRSENTSYRFLGGFAIVIEAIGFLFTIRDILQLFGD